MLDHLAYEMRHFQYETLLRREVTIQVPRPLPTSLPTRASTQGVILYVNLLFFNSRPESAT